MTYDGDGRIAVTNFLEKTCSIYEYDGGNISLLQYSPYNAGDVVHGVKFYSDDILAMTSRRSGSGIHFFKIDDVDPLFILRSDRASVQDFCFVSDNRLVMISTTKSPRLHPQEMWSSHIDVIDFDLENRTSRLISSLEISRSHLDNVVFRNSKLYMSDQYNDCILVVDPESLRIVEKYEGFDFPHGLDVDGNMLAVSNYGSNTIEIRMI